MGRALLWKAGGSSEAQTVVFEARQNLPWQPCHLRVTGGTATWLRRSADIPDSWAFPDDAAAGRFVAQFDSGCGFGGRLETNLPSCPVPEGTFALRVAEVGPDGRTGPWLSIGLGSPYL